MLTIKNRVGTNALLLVVLTGWLAGCMPPGPRALLDGKKLLERGHPAEAADRLREAASLLATNAQAWNYLGLAFHLSGQASNAVAAYQKALALDHDLVEAHFNLGCLWLEQDRPDFARAELITYTSLRRNEPEGWLKLAAAQMPSVKPASASARAVELAAAEKSYSEALRISAHNAEALNGLGLVQMQRNRPREAAQFFNSALKYAPDYAPAVLNLAIVQHTHLNTRESALAGYRRYLSLTPELPQVAAVKAVVRDLEQQLASRTAGTPVESAPALEAKAARPSVAPAAPPAGSARAEPAPTPPQPSPAATVPKPKLEAVKLAPEPTVAPPPRTTAETARVDKPPATSPTPTASSPRSISNPAPTAAPVAAAADSALKSFGRYTYRSPSRPATGDTSAAARTFTQGTQAHQAGRLAEAMQSYRRATQLDPGYYDAYYNLGLVATTAGKLEQALLAYEFALAIRPESPDARYNFALVLKQAGYVLDSANELEKLVAQYPREPRAHLALGNLYAQQLRQPTRAREHYTQVLQIDPRNPQAGAIHYWMQANPP